MKILAISAKYPTLYQTWFVNYLVSLERIGVDISVYSLAKGDANYHPKIDALSSKLVWTVNKGILRNVLSATLYTLRNLHNKKNWKYIRKSYSKPKGLKRKFQQLLLVPGLKERPDIIHCHSERAAVRMLPLLVELNASIVLTFHGLPPEGVPDITAKDRELLGNKLRCIFVNTKFAKNQCNQFYGNAIKTIVVPQGIDLECFPFRPASYSDESKVILLTVGRLDRLKGHIYAIQAVKTLIDQGLDVEYWIVGEGWYKKELEMEVDKLELLESVKLLGSKTGQELLSLYQSAHIFLLPSLEEGLDTWAETQGIVIQEAQAAGLLTVASKTGGLPECITHRETGFLVEQKSADSITNQIKFLLENQGEWHNWRLNARKDVESRFDCYRMGANLLKWYRTIV